MSIKKWIPFLKKIRWKSFSLWNLIEKLHQEFSKILLAKRIGTNGILHREAVNKLKNFNKNKNHFYYMIGFNALNNSEKLIFQTLLNTKQGSVLWISTNIFLIKTHILPPSS